MNESPLTYPNTLTSGKIPYLTLDELKNAHFDNHELPKLNRFLR